MLRALQEAIVDHLKADDFFDDIPVVAAVKGQLASAIESDLGKLGLIVIVEPVRGPLKHAGGKLSTEPVFQIHVFENVLLHRSGEDYVTAEDVTEKICHMLRGGQETAPPVYATSWELVNDLTEELQYMVEATTRGAIEITVEEPGP